MPFPVSKPLIERTETTLGRRLPVSYRAKMATANGGCVFIDGEAWFLYPIFDDSDVKRLKRTCNDLIRETREALSWPGFPEDAVAIAHNGAGDKLVFVPASSMMP